MAKESFFKKHKKQVIITAVALIVGIILFIVWRAHQKSAAAAAQNANPYAGAVTTVTPQTAGYGGEYGNGYAAANNLGQLSDQLQGLNGQIAALQSQSTTPANSGSSDNGSVQTNPTVTGPPPNIKGDTYAQAQSALAGTGYTIGSVSENYQNINPNQAGSLPIVSYTPHGSSINVGLQ